MTLGVGSLLEISVIGALFDQQVMNVWQYEIFTYPFTNTAAQIGESFWNHVKTPYRALVSAGFGNAFEKVVVREMDDLAGAYGEYAVPPAERVGTRSTGTSQGLPSFVAAGVRLSVATRVTRPGQKRFCWLVETDNSGPALDPAFVSLVEDVMDAATLPITLGAPTVGTELLSAVVRKNPTSGLPVTHQLVEAYSVNSNSTSQVSRKVGRGS